MYDELQQHDGSPYWSETSWFTFMVPEHNLNGWFYLYARPNMNLCGAGPTIWDRSGEENFSCLYNNVDPYLELPPGATLFNIDIRTAETHIACSTLERGKKFR